MSLLFDHMEAPTPQWILDSDPATWKPWPVFEVVDRHEIKSSSEEEEPVDGRAE